MDTEREINKTNYESKKEVKKVEYVDINTIYEFHDMKTCPVCSQGFGAEECCLFFD